MFVWHPPLSKIWLIAGIATFGAMCGSSASEDSSGVGILSKSESRELAKRYATYFAAACSVFEKFGLGVLPTESLSGSSSFDFDEAVEELKRRANELQGNDTPATRLELVRLACSSGNFLLAEIHLRQATSTATAPNSQSLRGCAVSISEIGALLYQACDRKEGRTHGCGRGSSVWVCGLPRR